MGQGQVPVGMGGGLVGIGGRVDLERHPGEVLGEGEVARGRVDRVDPEHQQGAHAARRHRVPQVGKGLGPEHRDRRGVQHRGAGVAERPVDAVDEGVDRRRLGEAGGDEAPAPVRLKRRAGTGQPRRHRAVRDLGPAALGEAQQILPESRDGVGAGRQGVVGLDAGEPRRRGRRVQGEEAPLREGGAARLDPAAGQADLPRPGIEEIPVEGDDGVGRREARLRLQGAAIGLARTGVEVVARHRLQHVPAQARIGRPQPRDLGGEARGGHRSRQEVKPGARARAQGRQARQQRGAEGGPGGRAPEVAHRLAAERVVEPEHRGLGHHVGAAPAPGMLGVALDLQGPPVAGGDQDAVGEAVEERAGRVGEGGARHDPLRLRHVGHLAAAPVDGFAGREPGHREGGRHELEESAPLRAPRQG